MKSTLCFTCCFGIFVTQNIIASNNCDENMQWAISLKKWKQKIASMSFCMKTLQLWKRYEITH